MASEHDEVKVPTVQHFTTKQIQDPTSGVRHYEDMEYTGKEH